MKRRFSKMLPLFLSMAILLTPSCNTSKSFQGAMVGGALGGIIGGALASKGKKARGILIGSVLGGAAGAAIGKYMDKQAEEIENDLENANVERVGEGILITFESGLLFDLNSFALKAPTKRNLEELSTILQKYDDTEILVQGHTDSSGDENYNLELSNNRAQSVANYLTLTGVKNDRLVTMGMGENEPVADNSTAAGRQKNRRVEIAIVANKKLRKAAERGDL